VRALGIDKTRVMELHGIGLADSVIAHRLGVSISYIARIIQQLSGPRAATERAKYVGNADESSGKRVNPVFIEHGIE
jgi:predicted transcriptional regulator